MVMMMLLLLMMIMVHGVKLQEESFGGIVTQSVWDNFCKNVLRSVQKPSAGNKEPKRPPSCPHNSTNSAVLKPQKSSM